MKLSQLDPVRRRPGMYIGDTHDGSGLHHMIWEVVGNSLDEHLAGCCSRIAIEVRADGAVVVDDDGRGIPLHLVDGISFAERVFTMLHDGPTLDGHAPHVHVGLHGVGVSIVCALSAWLELQVFQGSKCYWQRFERGRAVSKCEERGSTGRTGTTVTFAPDPEIFSQVWIDSARVQARLRELSYLLPALTLGFCDRREHVFHEPRGLQANVDARTPFETSLHPTFTVTGKVGDVLVEVAARWGSSGATSIESYANVERTTEGGSHVDGLLLGLVDALSRMAPELCRGVPESSLKGELSRGLTAIVCVRLDDPSYGGPTKDRLVTPEAKLAVQQCIADAFHDFLEGHPAFLEEIVAKLR